VAESNGEGLEDEEDPLVCELGMGECRAGTHMSFTWSHPIRHQKNGFDCQATVESKLAKVGIQFSVEDGRR
jgi:hypothetical protein